MAAPLADSFLGLVTRRDAVMILRRAFAAAGLDTPEIDARALLSGRLKLDPVDLVRDPDKPLAEREKAMIAEAGERRLAGEPVARVIGEREFWGLAFTLSPDTLEPRPDSETLVSAVLDVADHTGMREAPLRVLDLGTGTGCVLVALLHDLPNARGLGIDASFDAVETARGNAARHGLSARAAFITGDWSKGIVGPFDLVVSNPPYIETDAIENLSREVRDHDPRRALDGGRDGLDAYRAIIGDLKRIAAPDALIALEIGHDQAASVTQLMEQGGFQVIDVRRDLGGHARVVLGVPVPDDRSTT